MSFVGCSRSTTGPITRVQMDCHGSVSLRRARIVSGAWTCSAANRSCCAATGSCWSWTCSHAASSASVSSVLTSTASRFAGCSAAQLVRYPNRTPLSTDHDPLFRFHRWLANLRVLEIEEIKSVPYAPMSHPFVERLIGTIRRECLDRIFFCNAVDLSWKLDEFRAYYNAYRVHRSLGGVTPAQHAGVPSLASAKLDCFAWKQHCRGLFQTPTPA